MPSHEDERRAVSADIEYTNARTIEAQAMAERTRAEILQTQANAIMTLIGRDRRVFDPDYVVRAVMSGDLTRLLPPTENPNTEEGGSQVLIP